MATCTQLTSELNAIEKKTTKLRLTSDKRIDQEKERVRKVAAKRAQVVDEHQRHVSAYVEECMQQLTGMQEKTRREVEEAQQQRDDAKQREALHIEARDQADRRVLELEKQIKHMNKLLDQSRDEYIQKWSAVSHRTNEDVRQKVAEANVRVREKSDHAGLVQDGTLEVMEDMQNAMRFKLEETEESVKSRSRYRDLYNLATNRSAQDIDSDDYLLAKSKLLKEWHHAWHQVTGELQAVPGAVLENHKHNIDVNMTLPKPQASGEGRLLASKFVERCRDKAANDDGKGASLPIALRTTSGARSPASYAPGGGAVRLPPAAGATAF
eukprot:TRINITY_DN10975_c0_g1_i2.p1 TRINITY_DN10975_c0_g1~~TRINITY_DN10975_c0_g1_i2.p1  ORF type:complete len:325 (-),score=86.25 TRINITY_DN10975_c0_g1_i2:507-1481(-)